MVAIQIRTTTLAYHAVARARMVSMPNGPAAIDKAFYDAGADAIYEEIVYEGYGPVGVDWIVS